MAYAENHNTSQHSIFHNANHLPVIGSNDYGFDLIHITAIVSLAISILVSACVVIYLIRTGVSLKKKNVGERLAIHLATCDLLYSISHMLDHAYMAAVRGHPPDSVCVPFAFFLAEFILAQAFLIAFTAINAFLLVVREIRINLGVFDWKLLLGAYGIPAIGMVICACLGYIGPSGAWCLFDMRKESGKVVTTILSAILVTTFTINFISYVSVWIKIKQVSREANKMAGSNQEKGRYIGTARILSLFVIAYLLQWWPYVTYSVWAVFSTPHMSIYVLTVLLCNMGGVFNFVAYTFVRIILNKKKNLAEVKSSEQTAMTTQS